MSVARRRLLWGIGVVGVASLGAGGYVLGRDDDAAADGKGATRPPKTATVTREDLAETEQVDGQIEYGAEHELLAGRSGTLTWLPPRGRRIRRGDVVARIDEKPVALLYGTVPFYRRLYAGVEPGRDVRQLEKNLQALKLTDPALDVDDDFTGLTRLAVRELQDTLDVDRTGTVEPGDYALAPGEVRVDEQRARVGDQVGPESPVLTTTSTTLRIRAGAEPTLANALGRGDSADVLLADGTELPATVTSVGAVEKGGGEDDESTAPVLLRFQKGQEPPRTASAGTPVSVSLTRQVTRDALVVPVTALVALAEGGYAVEVSGGGSATRLLAVRPGAYAFGKVAISGKGVREGLKVVVPA